MKVFLHIGTAKTGSTWIQSVLDANGAILADSGFLYPKSLQWFSPVHLKLYWLALSPDIMERSRFVASLSDRDAFVARKNIIREEFRRELDRAKPDKLVLSCEQLSMYLYDVDAIHSLKSVLDEFGADTTVLVYLREQASLLPSFYSEEVKSGLRRRLRFESPLEGQTFWEAAKQRRLRFMEEEGNLISFLDMCPEWMDYERLLQRWSSVFGEGRMEVCRFGRNYLSSGDVLSDFSMRLGLPTTLDRTGALANTSDSATTTELRRWINHIIPVGLSQKWERRRRRLMHLSWINVPGGPVALSSDQTRSIFETFSVGNRAVAKKYFNEDSDLFA